MSDIVELVQWLWDKHWDHLLNTLVVLFVGCSASLLWDSVPRKAEKRDRSNNEMFERIRKAMKQKAEEILAEEKQRKKSGPKGRRLFKAPCNPGARVREEFRGSLRRNGMLLDDASGPECDSAASNLSPEDVLFDGLMKSDFTHEWDRDLKRRLRSYRNELPKRKGEKDSTLTELYKAKTTKPSAPPMKSLPPSEYYFGSDEHDESLQLNADRISKTEFEWYNADGWRNRACARNGITSGKKDTEGNSVEEEVFAKLDKLDIRHEVPSKEALAGLGLGNAFRKILADLREKLQEHNFSEESLETMALYKLNRMIYINFHAFDADEMNADTHVEGASDHARPTTPITPSMIEEEASSGSEEVQPGRLQYVSDYVWNTHLAGPCNNS